jgi:hypothetical protein
MGTMLCNTFISRFSLLITAGVLAVTFAGSLAFAQGDVVTSGTKKLFTATLDDKTEFIEKWYISGPFAWEGSPEVQQRWGNGYKPLVSLPSYDAFLAESYKSQKGSGGWVLTPIETVDMSSQNPATGKVRPLKTTIINFLKAYPDNAIKSSAYALAFVESPTDQTYSIFTGSDDGIAIWLNGENIQRVVKERPIVPDEDFAVAHFRKGVNVLLVEVPNAKGYWGFMLRLSSKEKTLQPTDLQALPLPSIP